MIKGEYKLKSMIELEKYLEDECYSFSAISIGNHRAWEGIYLEEQNKKFIFGFSEKGQKNIIKIFDMEEALVEYALKELNSNKWFKAHLVARTLNEKLILEAEKELEKLSVDFCRNDIPHVDLEDRTEYRIFVFGKDIKKLSKFQKIYRKEIATKR